MDEMQPHSMVGQIRPTARAAEATLIAAIVTMGLIAGTYYAFACAVMPGLAHTDDANFVQSMRRINESIQNPVFFASFFGAFVLTGITAVQYRRTRGTTKYWIIAALVLYTLTLISTSAINVPLNDALAGTGMPLEPHSARAQFEGTWNLWNIIRALISTVALGCLGRALAGAHSEKD